MDTSFVTPFPHFLGESADPNQKEKVEFWRSSLDALSQRKITWEKFFQDTPLASHPARLLTTTETGESLLHLAVLLNRLDQVREIVDCLPQLKWRRNRMNLTPLELARFLPNNEIVALLETAPLLDFFNQPNVLIPDPERSASFRELQYLRQPLFESAKIFEEILFRCQKAKMEDAIPPEKIWMGIYFDKELQTEAHPKVSIRFIDEKVGFGVFAEQRIPSCAFAGEYRGVVQERKRKELKGKLHCARYTVWEMGRRQFSLDAAKMGNFTRFINHSDKPNLSFQSVYWKGIPRMIFVALKEIPEGTQLTFDYGTFFWKECRQTPVLFE
jgi:hypothetical protein